MISSFEASIKTLILLKVKSVCEFDLKVFAEGVLLLERGILKIKRTANDGKKKKTEKTFSQKKTVWETRTPKVQVHETTRLTQRRGHS